ncbi:hypothetical protein M406DRAFT_239251, partial [Cryphonectria parasitica EP155]
TLAPQTDLMLSYGLNSTKYVNVSLTTTSPGVLLESINSITAVECSVNSVSMVFNSSETLDAALAEWSGYDELVLVTNHMGDCDTEFERGFFVAAEWTSDSSALSLVASAEKTNVTNVASYMRANFTGLPSTTSTVTSTRRRKRDVVIDPSDVTISTEWDLPATTLYEYDPYFTAKADSGAVALSVMLGGYLDFDVSSATLASLYVDVETTTSVDLVLELDVTAPYDGNFSYGDGVEYYLVNVPGILTFGPELTLAVGAEISVDAAVDIVLDLGAEIDNGTVHLDLVGNGTTAAGWTPSYHANLTLGEEATVGVTPFVSVTVELDFEILGGLLDLSAGLTPEVSFPVTATLDAAQGVSAGTGTNVTVAQVVDGAGCSNGVEVLSDFEFNLELFVTEFWSESLYNVTVPIADECYSW